MRGLTPLVTVALIAGCGGGGSDEARATGGAGGDDIIVTPVPGEAQKALTAAVKPLLKTKRTDCAITVLSDLTAVEWVNLAETLMNAELGLKSAVALQTAQIRKSIGAQDLSGKSVPVQVVIIDKRVTELRIEGSDLRAALEAAGVMVNPGAADQISALSEEIQYVLSSGSVTLKAKSAVATGRCPSS